VSRRAQCAHLCFFAPFPRPMPAASPGARRPQPVAATTSVRMGMRAGRKASASMICAGPVGGGGRSFPVRRASGKVGEWPLHRDANAEPCACTPVAQSRQAITSPCSGWVALTRFAQPDAGGPFRRPPHAY
jgi:hypothetical protein